MSSFLLSTRLWAEWSWLPVFGVGKIVLYTSPFSKVASQLYLSCYLGQVHSPSVSSRLKLYLASSSSALKVIVVKKQACASYLWDSGWEYKCCKLRYCFICKSPRMYLKILWDAGWPQAPVRSWNIQSLRSAELKSTGLCVLTCHFSWGFMNGSVL